VQGVVVARQTVDGGLFLGGFFFGYDVCGAFGWAIYCGAGTPILGFLDTAKASRASEENGGFVVE